MRILVFGAGPLGSLLAVRLHQGGQDVTLLARGKRLADLKEYGVCLKNWTTKEEESVPVKLVERLEPEDLYDLILVVMRKNSALKILTILSANPSPNIAFLMNNAAGPDALTGALGKERVLIGFPGAAGYREKHKIVYLNAEPERPAGVSIGEPDGGITERTKIIAAEIEKGKYLNVVIEPDMDAWSKYHVALLFPSLAPAFYLCNHDRLRVARTRDAVVLAYRAMKEGFMVLRKLGYPVTPKYLKRFLWLPEPVMVSFLQRLLKNPKMEVAMERHAEVIQDEILQLIGEFMELVEKSGLFTSTIQFMASQMRSQAPTLPDGSKTIRLHWEGITIPLMVLVLLGLIIALVF
ncbi:MAG TPA: 2-dehydropantoate 2-reductase N-terminal domain-containing protein [Pelolinea sp.]|nr:2-dehydropantoate 2-reductase N-terminal domain-containing protein [Pelolinea sp.]